MSVFVDSSVWFAAANSSDRHNVRAKVVLKSIPTAVITDHVLVETWLLLNSRMHRRAAESSGAPSEPAPPRLKK